MTKPLGYNFSAGPGLLPPSIIQQARQALIEWQNTPFSVLELNHRSDAFQALLHDTEQGLRELLIIPSQYRILFLAGGASVQFAAVPLNLLGEKTGADYVKTGYWSGQAIREGSRYTNVSVIAEPQQREGKLALPLAPDWSIHPQAAYLHYTANETVEGLEFFDIPPSQGVPLVSDMTSNLLSRPLDVSQFGLIYAGAQKNIAPAGLTVVIVREDLLERAQALTPSLYHYKTQAQQHSCMNTPPIFQCYIASLMVAWIKQQGGLTELAKKNDENARQLYACIDASAGFYQNRVHPDSRSRANVTFHLASSELESAFVSQAADLRLYNLAGHRSAGGLRVSLYNAMPPEGVAALVNFMQDFMRKHA